MKKASLIVLTAIIFLMSAVPAFAKEEESSSHQELVNVRAFAKLYGYVRFFHPSDENETIDWNRFAIYGVGKVKGAKTRDELTTSLRELFYPIAPTLRLTEQDKATRLSPPKQAKNLTAWLHFGVGLKEDVPLYKSFRQQSDNITEIKFKDKESAYTNRVLQAGENVVKQITPNVYAHIPIVLYRNDKGTIGATSKSTRALEELQQQLSKIDLEKASVDNENVRLANIIISWNVFQHFYPYFDVVEVNWEQALTDTLQQSLKDRTADQFAYTMKQMLVKTKDGHSNLFPTRKDGEKGFFPFRVTWAEEQVVVVNTEEGIDLKPGDIILTIDGKSAKSYFKQLENNIAGTEQYKRSMASLDFTRGPGYGGIGKVGSEAKLQIQRGEHKLNIAIPYIRQHTVDEFIRPANIDKVDDDIYYINLNNVTMDMFKEKIHELENAKGVIFDLRGYPNANHDVLSYLTDVPVQQPQMYIPVSLYPDQEKVDFYFLQSTFKPSQPKLKGKIVFLTYGGSISYAEMIMDIVKHYRLAEIVGETTAGANGNTNIMQLPGGYVVPWTGMKVLKHDGSQHHLIGIQPTIPVKRRIKEIREGRDIYMEKAIEVIEAAKRK